VPEPPEGKVTDPIVTGTDGSITAERAVDRAGELALALGAVVHVVNCYASVSAAAMLAAAGGVAMADVPTDEDAHEHAREVVARSRDRLTARGVTVRTHVCSGDPAQALMGIADDEHAQMIVVGNRGMSGARRLLGSVPNRVSHQANCCVLIVPTS
jgi:nucleotide-binding universal stress UspA family protein